MIVLIIGAGRMGVRHLQGALKAKRIKKVILLDIKKEALEAAANAVGYDSRLEPYLIDHYTPQPVDLCIIASTAKNRKPLIDLAVNSGCRYLMIEKPLGQSYEEVEKLAEYTAMLPMKTVVNLSKRMYEPILKLKHDMEDLPQMKGAKTITVNTGSLGIGCNGIHYLDKLFFILNADKAEIVAAEIDEQLLQSGRGADFCDFGGWAVIKFYSQDHYVGKALISMASNSAAFGGWEIIAPFGRIVLDEIQAIRRTILRKEESTAPIYRYFADFSELPTEKYEAPMLSDLTTKWIDSITEDNINLLPELSESLKAHKLMFDWLAFSKTHSKVFPIT